MARKREIVEPEDRMTVDVAVGEMPLSGPVESRSLAPSNYDDIDGVPVPDAATLADPMLARQWAETELIKATPRAVQEVLYQLRKGDSKTRALAALQILDRAGVQAKASSGGNQAPVIILTPQVVQNLPWLKQAEKKGQIIDGKLVEGALEDATKE